MSNHWQLMGSSVWSRLDGNRVLDPLNPNNVVPSMREGRGANDQPHAFKLIGTYQAPWGINLGANFESLSGLPRDRSLSVGVTQGTTTFQVDPRGAYRYDFLNLLSLRADKSFKINGQRRFSLIGEIHNALNSSADRNTVGTRTRSFASQAAFDAARTGTSYFGRIRETVFRTRKPEAVLSITSPCSGTARIAKRIARVRALDRIMRFLGLESSSDAHRSACHGRGPS
jgi:hypothetical protein